MSESTDQRGRRLVQVEGCWKLQRLAPELQHIDERLGRIARGGEARWDLQGIEAIDHAGAALLRRAWLQAGSPEVLTRPEHEPLFRRIEAARASPLPSARKRLPPWLVPGVWVLHVLGHLHGFVVLVGLVAMDIARALARPWKAPWREISANLYRTGAQALAITALVGFLIGVVLSFLSSNQLKLFGADLFIVNILGVSIIRELGPVLAAILVAGRSGSSMTAQLGVMRVTQELDAMSVMGIPQMYRLVMPKVVALAIGLPLLILWTDAVALLGGMVAAQAELGLSMLFFIDTLPAVVPIANLYLGIGKGVVFGVLIALLACHYGLRIRPNTESLGAGTTSSVVTAITMVILVDAVFAVLFRDVGLGF
ncbi:MAG: ABC transporter permease [Burkholderiales bacterium]|nr:ABC transporter permease [Burkholderiales bacterium]